MRGLDPTDKAVRVDGYIRSLRYDLMALAHAMGHEHPGLISLDQITITDGVGGVVPAATVVG